MRSTTFSIQHFWNVQMLLSNIKGIIQVLQGSFLLIKWTITFVEVFWQIISPVILKWKCFVEVRQWLQAKWLIWHSIDLIPKWMPLQYYFDCMTTSSPTCLVQNKIIVYHKVRLKTRQQGLIWKKQQQQQQQKTKDQYVTTMLD